MLNSLTATISLPRRLSRRVVSRLQLPPAAATAAADDEIPDTRFHAAIRFPWPIDFQNDRTAYTSVRSRAPRVDDGLLYA